MARCLIFAVLITILACIDESSGCSCMPTHPQKHACDADFVIIAKVKSVFNSNYKTTIHKVIIKKEFKMREKAREALERGLLVSPGSASSCGVTLKKDETYLLTGRLVAGKARLSLCDFIKPWHQVTARQRKGFRLLYKQACHCEIENCPSWRNCTTKGKKATCHWQTNSFRGQDCQSDYSICMKQENGRCGWSSNKRYKECMQNREVSRKNI